jgi:hypothetical protein
LRFQVSTVNFDDLDERIFVSSWGNGMVCLQPPVPADGWNGVRDAKYDRDRCFEVLDPEALDHHTVESEDCLYLNVFTPEVSRGRFLILAPFAPTCRNDYAYNMLIAPKSRCPPKTSHGSRTWGRKSLRHRQHGLCCARSPR